MVEGGRRLEGRQRWLVGNNGRGDSSDGSPVLNSLPGHSPHPPFCSRSPCSSPSCSASRSFSAADSASNSLPCDTHHHETQDKMTGDVAQTSSSQLKSITRQTGMYR